MRRSALLLTALVISVISALSVWSVLSVGPAVRAQAAAVPADIWPQFGGDPAHSGNDRSETDLSAATVGRLARTFSASLPGTADGGQPAYLAGVATSAGPRDLLFVETTAGSTVALDARTGTQVWVRMVGPGSCRINNGSSPCYTTSQPAVDPGGSFVYSYGLDGFVHKWQAATGTEVTGGGWPERVTLKSYDEKGSSNLSIATARSGTSYLYVANGGYPGDRGDYQGHLTAIDLGSGAQRVFNTLCSGQSVHFSTGSPDCAQVQSAVWARAGAVYDRSLDALFLSTGNGDFNPAAHDWGDSVLRLNPDGTGASGNPVDTYTPTNYTQLDEYDQDLGSTEPAILTAPSGSSVTHLGVQGGKDAKLRLINLADLSGHGGPGHTGGELQLLDVPQGGQVLTQPVSWLDPTDASSWVFVANNSGLSGLKVALGAGSVPRLVPQWTVSTRGTTPVIANGVLYYLTDSGARAVNPRTGTQLWSDNAGSVGLHWQALTVANGWLYYPDGSGHVNAYGLPAACGTCVPGTYRPVAPARVSDSRVGTGGVSGPVGARRSVRVPVAGVAGVPGSGVSAVVLTVTVTDAAGSGFVTAFPDGSAVPEASNVNFVAGQTVANLVTVPVGAGGAVDLFNGSWTGSVDLVADIAGYYLGGRPSAAGAFVSAGPARVLDSRVGTGGVSGPVGARRSVRVPVAGVAGVPGSGVSAVVLTVTVTDAAGSGFVTAFPDGSAVPEASNVNFVAGQTVANLVTVPVGAGGAVDLFNGSWTGSVDLVADVAGYYLGG